MIMNLLEEERSKEDQRTYFYSYLCAVLLGGFSSP